MDDAKSEKLQYQVNKDKFQSQIPPMSANHISEDNEGFKDMLNNKLEQQVVVSSLLKTSENMGYGQEEYEEAAHAMGGEEDPPHYEEGGEAQQQSNTDQASEGLTRSIDKLNKAYNTERAKVFDSPVDQSNTNYRNSRYHQS